MSSRPLFKSEEYRRVAKELKKERGGSHDEWSRTKPRFESRNADDVTGPTLHTFRPEIDDDEKAEKTDAGKSGRSERPPERALS